MLSVGRFEGDGVPEVQHREDSGNEVLDCSVDRGRDVEAVSFQQEAQLPRSFVAVRQTQGLSLPPCSHGDS